MDILIGVGGTGAKVVEATLHACAAGLGPSELHVGFVDQDRGNGNVSRAMETREVLEQARRLWRTPGESHLLGGGELFACQFPLIGNDRWVPHLEDGTTLLRILGDLQGDQPLANLLFAPGVREQELELDLGYRGLAHIGSAAITHAIGREEEPFWKALRTLIQRAQNGEPVRLVLAGSAFGGTGASGFPTIARLIRKWLTTEGIEENFSMAGVLMLPYFNFDPPPNLTDNFAKSELLLTQTRDALNYYHALERREPGLFDDLFLVGWDRRANLGYFSPGKGEQRNPALLPELFAALGICTFYERDYIPTHGVLATARESDGSVAWSDLPSPDPNDRDAPYRLLGRQLRFAAALKFWGPMLKKQQGWWDKKFARDGWHVHFKLDTLDYDAAPPAEAVDAASRYFDLLLKWAAAIQLYVSNRTPDLAFGLWNVQPLLEGTANFAKPQDPIVLRAGLREQEWSAAFDAVIAAQVESNRLTDAAWITKSLNIGQPLASSSGLGGIMGALHVASIPTDITAAR